MNWDNFFIILFFGIPILLVLYGMFDWFVGIKNLFSLRNRKINEKVLLQKGIKTNALVINIIQTGVFVNENPEVDLILHSSYNDKEITIRTVVSLVLIPRLQPGCNVVVFVDPKNPNIAALER